LLYVVFFEAVGISQLKFTAPAMVAVNIINGKQIINIKRKIRLMIFIF